MLESVVLIKNVGKFHNCSSGNIRFQKLTLIFGPNGTGKTTLSDVFRSLSLGNSDILIGRKRLSSDEQPEVVIQIEKKNHIFSKGAWKTTHSDLLVFDKTYVHENVFSGDHVFHDHKKRLYQVILGDFGTKIARQIEVLAKDISDVNREINGLKTAIEASVPSGLTVTEFISLPITPELDRQLIDKKKEVTRLAESESIRLRQELSLVTLPILNFDIELLLSRTVESLSASAESQVRDHITRLLSGKGEGWLADGLVYLEKDDCPFCGQKVASLEIIGSFQAYFSKEYARLKSELSSARITIDNTFGEASLLSIQKTISTNESNLEFWTRFIKSSEIDCLDFSTDIQPILSEFRHKLHLLLAKKKESPLDKIEVDNEYCDALSQIHLLGRKIENYNLQISNFNRQIKMIKSEVMAGDVRQAKKEVAVLEATAIRHTLPASTNCELYLCALNKKQVLESGKDQAKTRLDEYSKTVCEEHESAINNLLEKFGSGFRLNGTQHQYVGGSPSSTFQLNIQGISVDVGDERTSLAKPSFGNTLSSGDRTTLAFAFFAVQLDRDPRLNEKIVIFDDPFTSQDEYRRTVTQHLILRYAGKAKQVIVLSHDLSFLRNLWDECPKKTVSQLCLQLRREQGGSGLHPFDIEEATASDYYVMYRKLVHYRDENIGEAFDIAKTVRPFLECWIKLQCPGNNFGSLVLGKILNQIQNADPKSDLGRFHPLIEEMVEINNYATQFHHADKPLTVKAYVDETQLLAFVNRTLKLLC